MPFRKQTQTSSETCFTENMTASNRNKRFPGGARGKEPICQCRICKICRFDPWIRKIPRRSTWQPDPVFLSGESLCHRPSQRSLQPHRPSQRVSKSRTWPKQLSTAQQIRSEHSLSSNHALGMGYIREQNTRSIGRMSRRQRCSGENQVEQKKWIFFLITNILN